MADNDESQCVTINLKDERLRRLAIENGCHPIWSEDYKAWCCGCDDGLHMGDQQCSIISFASAVRHHLVRDKPAASFFEFVENLHDFSEKRTCKTCGAPLPKGTSSSHHPDKCDCGLCLGKGSSREGCIWSACYLGKPVL